MLLILSIKCLSLAFISFTLAGAAVGTGILFSGYAVAVSKNPEESDNIFNVVLIAFAMIETFVFMSFILGFIIYFA